MRIGYLVSHPIQYYAPVFRELARLCDLTVFFAHRQTAEQQAGAGFGVAFEWDVDLLSGYSSKFLQNVARAPSTDRFFGCSTPGIAAEIARGGFDAFVVPGWGLRSYLQAVGACRRVGVPIMVRGDSQLVTERSVLKRLAKATIFPRLLGRFDGFLYVGQRNRAYLAYYGAPNDRLFFAPACVDNQAFDQAARLARAAAQVRRSGNKRILFAGKLIERKRPLELVQAAAVVRRQGLPVEVVFAGSGELQEMLRQAAATADLPAEFLGFVNQSELPSVYAGVDLLALPSDGAETWGLVVNEAMACGLPAVVSDAVGCGPDLVRSGRTGAVFPLGNVAAFAKALETALAIDPDGLRHDLEERLDVHSPRRTAQGIMGAAETLSARQTTGNEGR